MKVTSNLGSPHLAYFLRLVKQGRNRGCSTSERNCHQIASALVDGVPGLDDQALHGLCEFIVMAREKPMTARDLLKGGRS